MDAHPASPPDDDATVLRLPPSLDPALAETLRGDLLARLARDAAIRIDGRDVDRVGTPCLQVLAAAAVSARAHGGGLALAAPSETLRHAIAQLGLSRLLDPERP